jgi:uncharacterized Zn finger protein
MGTWVKLCISILFLCTALSAVSGCGKDEYKNEREIGEEFSLHIGETASLNGEDLRIQFLEISEDSRCPRDVTCVWEGRAIAIIKVSKGNTSQKIELVVPGLTDTLVTKQFEEYEFVFKILPYPEAEVQISPEEYRLILTVNKE